MKKFLAVLLSLVLCATVVYSVGAEEVAIEDEVVVTPEDEMNTTDDLMGWLATDPVAQEKAEEIVEAIQTGAPGADIAALWSSFVDYVNDAGYDIPDLQDPAVIKILINTFLDDAGVDSEALNDALSDTTFVDAFLGSYDSGNNSGSGSAGGTLPDGFDSVDDIAQPIPDTDFIG